MELPPPTRGLRNIGLVYTSPNREHFLFYFHLLLVKGGTLDPQKAFISLLI